jgi:phosphoribosyl 1,2-cyclic phosphodiesterase
MSEKLKASRSITFLGTGPSNPITERRGKSRRENSSAYINYHQKIYRMDVPAAFSKNKFDFLFLTHLHKDAFGGFNKVKNENFLLAVPEKLSNEIDYDNKKILSLNKRNSIGDLTVIPFPVKHDIIYGFPTFGYQFVFDDKKKLTYASDMVGIPKESEKYFNDIDILITDGAGWKSNLATHFGIWPFLDMVEEKSWDIGKIYFTQIGRPVPEHEKAQAEISERNSKYHLAYDGLHVTL